jgi:DNA-binding PadR family transcriptional regulator
LLKARWIEDRWEDPPPDDRPRKRFYMITSTGREMYAAALREREQRRAGWFRPVTETGPTS